MTHEKEREAHQKDLELVRALMGSQHQTVSISGNTAALAVSIFAVFVLVAAIAAVIIIGVMRDADVRDMAQLRSRVTALEMYKDQHQRRLSELENGSGSE